MSAAGERGPGGRHEGVPAGVVALLLRKLIVRAWRRSPGQTLLLLAVLSLGVAVFVAVRLANRAAVSSFTHFTETLTGQSDWIIQPAAGTLAEAVLPELRAALGTRAVHIIPVLETSAAAPAGGGASSGVGAGAAAGGGAGSRENYTLLGVDLLSLGNLAEATGGAKAFFARDDGSADEGEPTEANGGVGKGDGAVRGGAEAADFWTSFRGGPQVWVSADRAARAGRTLSLVVSEKIVALPIAGAIPQSEGMPRVPDSLVVLDLPELQALAGMRGELSRVEFRVEPGPEAARRSEDVSKILTALGEDGKRWSVESPGTRRETAETMTRAFRLNLTVLSLIALLVGLYLIFQTLDGAVVRRRGEIAILRSLGVPESTVRRVWLGEALLLGVVGGGIGILLGWAGAQVSVRAVGQTINALYYATTVSSAHLSGLEVVIAMGVSLAASLVAGWWPARAAARTPPAQLLVRHAAQGSGRLRAHAMLGAGLVLAGVVLAQLPPVRFSGGGRFPLAGYAAAFLWIFGGGLVCGWVLPLGAWIGRRAAGGGAAARIAFSHLKRPSSRHRFAVAALLCAIGMSAGMAILVASFELSVRGWIETSLRADLYIASAGAKNASARNTLMPETWRAISRHPAVARASVVNHRPIEIGGLSTELGGVDQRNADAHLIWVKRPEKREVFDPEKNEGLALASESFCERFQTGPGKTVGIPTPAGVKTVELAGVFADYGNERGSLLVDRAHLRVWFDDDRVTTMSVTLNAGASPEALRAELLERYPGLTIFENGALRAEILRIFRQTFSITYALELIAVFVAVVGLGMTLASVLLDRREELTTLRALGFSRSEIARALAIEGGAIAACGVGGGLAVSFALGWLLIHVVNKQSFGWTLGYASPWAELGGLAAAVIATGVVVSYFVGRWGAALPADREE